MPSGGISAVWEPTYPLGPDALIPLLIGRRLEMFKALEENDSYYELSLLFTDMADDLRAMGHITGASGAELKILGDRTLNNRSMFMLLHSIPKDLLRSVILGTTAFEMLQSRRPARYSLHGPGAYVVSMAIEGRGGKWLCRREIEQLIGLLQRYLDAFEAWKNHRGIPTSDEDKELNLFAKEIDTQYGRRDPKKQLDMRFIRDSSVWKLEDFIASLKRRCDPSLPDSDIVRQISSPLYTGCSKSMKTRVTVYDPSNGLKNVNDLWALVCSVLSSMGKYPKAVVVPVIRTWNRGDLPLAEILVTMLASSMVCHDGFNGHGPGTATDGGTVDELKEAEKYVLVHEPHLLTNIETTNREMARRESYLRNCNIVGSFPNRKTKALLDEVQKRYHDVRATMDKWETSYKKLMANEKELEAKLAAAEKYVEYLKHVEAIFRAIVAVSDQRSEQDDDTAQLAISAMSIA
ncbi:hypothetical protein F4818DRAFT_446003 [Hypoxylon cercidicola]|nr:hypothetical protein F4818DRAFT_446003 [Hypoxylon cercidicola]